MTATKPQKPKPKILPPHAVIVEDDDVHTFAYVIITMQKVFGYSLERCEKIANDIDRDGQCLVWSGSKELAELKVELIRSAGPDIWAGVNFPLGCRIEPMA